MLEKLQELILDQLRVKEDDYEDESDILHAIKELQRRKKDMKLTEEE